MKRQRQNRCLRFAILVVSLIAGVLGLTPISKNRLLWAGEGQMKKVVMIIAADGFRDEELLQPKEILTKAGIGVSIASTVLDEAKGMLGAKVKPDMLVSQINPLDFDALIFVGGIGAQQYWDDPLAHQLVNVAYENGRILAAICIAPVTLAKAGVLKDKRATVWPSEAAKLKENGANYTGNAVEIERDIITASGPQAAVKFAEAVRDAVLAKERRP